MLRAPIFMFINRGEASQLSPQNRDKNGRFIKGNNANPGGRPKMPETLKKALADLVPESIEVKRQILFDELAPLDLKNKVADSILDRVYGKPGFATEESAAETLNRLDGLLEEFKDAVKPKAD